MGLLYIGWNAVWAVSVVYTKLPEYDVSELLFSQSFVAVMLSGLGYIFFNATERVSLDTYLPSIVFGALIMMANYFFTYGILWNSNTGISTMMLMASAVLGYFISIFRYDETVNLVSLFGTIVLVGSALFIVYEQEKTKK